MRCWIRFKQLFEKRKALTAAAFLLALMIGALALHPSVWKGQPPKSDVPLEELLQTRPVDVNTAAQEELMTLPGIGEQKAKAIVEDRTANGPYGSIDEVTRVKGIGTITITGWQGLAYAAREGSNEAG